MKDNENEDLKDIERQLDEIQMRKGVLILKDGTMVFASAKDALAWLKREERKNDK